jgi:hypothetical protein
LKSIAFSPASKSTPRHFIALLIVVVLFAQWMGMRHRIEHAGWINNHAPTALAFSLDVDEQNDAQDTAKISSQVGSKSHHSCALFDGTALADTVAIIPLTLPPPACAKVLALWLAFTSWDAPLTRFFSSRAPPPAQ